MAIVLDPSGNDTVLIPFIDSVSEEATVNLPRGYDEPSQNPGEDWTMLTDSGAFFLAGVPFLYLGVDYHPHYHAVSDEYENMTLEFFQNAVAGSVMMAETIDDNLQAIISAPSREEIESGQD